MCSQCRQCSRSIHCSTCSDLLPSPCALRSHPDNYVLNIVMALKAIHTFSDAHIIAELRDVDNEVS
jgi:hypothetical protein